jgi:hypothetical protein
VLLQPGVSCLGLPPCLSLHLSGKVQRSPALGPSLGPAGAQSAGHCSCLSSRRRQQLLLRLLLLLLKMPGLPATQQLGLRLQGQPALPPCARVCLGLTGRCRSSYSNSSSLRQQRAAPLLLVAGSCLRMTWCLAPAACTARTLLACGRTLPPHRMRLHLRTQRLPLLSALRPLSVQRRLRPR